MSQFCDLQRLRLLGANLPQAKYRRPFGRLAFCFPQICGKQNPTANTHHHESTAPPLPHDGAIKLGQHRPDGLRVEAFRPLCMGVVIGLAQVGPLQVGPVQADPAQVGPAQVDSGW